MMRYLIPILIVLVLTSGLWIGCSQESSVTTLMTYTNKTYGYSIEYPSSWRIDELGEKVRIYHLLQEHISIGVTYVKGLTTESFNWLADDMVEGLQTEVEDFRLISKTQLFESDYPAWEVVWTGKTNEGLALRSKTRLIAHRNRAYVITVGAPGSKLPSSLNNALNSFRLLEQPETEIEEFLTYYDEISPLVEEYLETLVAVLDADATVLRAIQARNEQALIEELLAQNKVQKEALNMISSHISFLEIVTPPAEAETLHEMMMGSLNNAHRGMTETYYATAVMYDKLCSELYPKSSYTPIWNGDYPDVSREKGVQWLCEALDIMNEVNTEMDNLFEFFGIKTK